MSESISAARLSAQKGPGVTFLYEQRLVKRRTSLTD
jgi:hypothetical protein